MRLSGTSLDVRGTLYRYLPEVLKLSFCGRYSGKWNDITTDAGMVWTIIERFADGPKEK